ncbi:MAG: serine hydrolase domain-containing protein [Oceanicaulis sp.]
MSAGFATSALQAAERYGMSVDGLDSLKLSRVAKEVCSGWFLTGRKPADVLAASVDPTLPSGRMASIEIHEDRVVARAEGALERVAAWCGDQGAVLLPEAVHAPFFTPYALPARKGDRFPAAISLPLQARLRVAFEECEPALTAAVVVLHRGRLVAERYRPGLGAGSLLPVWSIGKTWAALLAGVLTGEGRAELDAPIGLPEWSEPGDPRGRILLRHVLQMSSGLDFTAGWASDYDGRYPDHDWIYEAGIAASRYGADKPLKHAPGTFGAYKNSDTLALARLIEDRCTARGIDPLVWAHEALFGPLGVRPILETDPYGRPFYSGNAFATARDAARIGQLILDRGMVRGRRLVPERFIDFMAEPAPAWSGLYWNMPGPKGWRDSIYGGQIWLNRHAPEDAWPAPGDAVFMMGIGGQYVFVVPSLDLIVVRIGWTRGVLDTGLGRAPTDALLASVVEWASGET